QNDILKEFMVRNTYIYPPGPSMRIVGDIIRYCAEHMPRFNPISVSGYHMQEAGASPDIELAYTIADGLEYLRAGLKAGLSVDEFAPRFSFFFGIGMNLLVEVAKLRAARLLWASVVRSFGPKNPKSMALRTHCQTSGWSLTAQDPENNVTRTTVEALAAILGHTQSLHTNSLDEAIALPTPETAEVARNTQLILQNESDITDAVDGVGGSYCIEQLTVELARRAWAHLQEVESYGGMTEAIEQGIPKLRIEESAARRQGRIDSRVETVVGMNRFVDDSVAQPEILEVDNRAVLSAQLTRLAEVRHRRSEKKVDEALEMVRRRARTEGSLLEACVEAARARATLGEISAALESEFGRHVARTHLVSGAYSSEVMSDEQFQKAQLACRQFEADRGRRPRILVAKLGQDGHDRGARVVASSFADIGFDVDVGPLFQTPEEVARQAAENDVHVVGISTLAGGHRALVPELMTALSNMGRSDILVVVGGVVPEKDRDELIQLGVAHVFGPGTVIAEACLAILERLGTGST
ncbi:MAG: methylmalonyl-CoA mutase family protein, partial [Rhodothermales bacterium]|nr:methylmalonyl-CoA mutase family protein [Rhodothermales bacterium]